MNVASSCSTMEGFAHPLSEHLLSSSCMPGTVLSGMVAGVAVSRPSVFPASYQLLSSTRISRLHQVRVGSRHGPWDDARVLTNSVSSSGSVVVAKEEGALRTDYARG